MNIEWNKVTWYSKLAAIVIFVGTFFIAFYLGRDYQKVMQADSSSSSVVPSAHY